MFRSGVVKAEDLFGYIEHKAQYTKPLKRKDYNEALDQIEAAIKEESGNSTPAKVNEEILDNDEPKRGIKRKLSTDNTDIENESKVAKKLSPPKIEKKIVIQSKFNFFVSNLWIILYIFLTT